MKNTLALLLSSICLILFASAANANMTYVCTKGADERIITVVYDSEGRGVPCEVTYQKEDQSIQGLWRAKNTEGYCEAMAAEFVKKQEGWGWLCELVADSRQSATESANQ